MKLGEFFTSLEITDGLASLPRVEKLVSVMQQDKSYISKNMVEATRHWSTVASILTATKNMDCLRQFITLGGLHCLDRWIQEAQRCGNISACDNSVEGLISYLLEALVKLPMDQNDLKSCGISNTVRILHSHINSEIRGKAKNLSNAWERFTNTGAKFEKRRGRISADHENSGCSGETFPKLEEEHPTSELTIPPKDAGDCTKGDASSRKPQHSSSVSSTGGLPFEAGMDMKDNISAEETSGTTSGRNYESLSSTGSKEVAGDGSPKNGETSTDSSELILSTENVSIKSEAGTATEKSFNQEESEKLAVGGKKSNHVNAGDDSLRSMVLVGFDDKQSKMEPLSSNSILFACPVSSSCDSHHKTSLETGLCSGYKKASGMNGSVCIGFNCSLEERSTKSMALERVEHRSLDYWKKIVEWKCDKQIDSYIVPKAAPDASVSLVGKPGSLNETSQAVETYASVTVLAKEGNLAKTSQTFETIRANDTGKVVMMTAEQNSSILEKTDVSKPSLFQKKNTDLLNKERDELELAFGLDDALEVARRVAREVEQEVGIYREASGSSSLIEERNGQTIHLSTADSVEPKTESCSVGIGVRSEPCSEQGNQDSCCSSKNKLEPEILGRIEQSCLEMNDRSQEIVQTRMGDADDGLNEPKSSQLTAAPEDEVANDQITHFCGFDLNEDIRAEEVEFPEQWASETISHQVVSLSTPIPVVATSRGPASLPTTPLQFEGMLGWKGSAATSAFRPASLCKFPNKEKAFSIDENNCSLRSSQGFQGIDLNIADAGDDQVTELFPGKHVSLCSGQPSGESSAEVSLRRAERLNLDLNRLGDNDDNYLDLRADHKLDLHTNGACSPSQAFLSSPFARDFDLNDNPSLGEARNDFYRKGRCTRPFEDGAFGDPAFSVVGTRIQLNSNNVAPASQADFGSFQGFGHGHLQPIQPFLMAGHNALTPAEQTGRMVSLHPTLAYTSPPAFSYTNGFGVGPMIPSPSTIYPSGMVPYMIDMRGAAIIPQILGSSPLPTFSRSPHLRDASGGPDPCDVAILRPGLDLNAGLTSLEMDSRGGNARHSHIPANNSQVEEQTNSFQHNVLSGVSMKRKEPDCGWEPYQVGYKHATSWR